MPIAKKPARPPATHLRFRDQGFWVTLRAGVVVRFEELEYAAARAASAGADPRGAGGAASTTWVVHYIPSQ